jgi:hypothetical protein
MRQGQVGKVGTAWFLATQDDRGIWLCGNASCFKRTPKETMPESVAALWILSGITPIPPEEWPPRVCAAVAKEMLSQ